MSDYEIKIEPASECVVCGSVIDYCQGHGYPEANYAQIVWAAHDVDCHHFCKASCRGESARGVLVVSWEYGPDDVHDGEIDYQEVAAEWHPGVSTDDAAHLFGLNGLTFCADLEVWDEGDARGEDVNYSTGIVTELEGFVFGYSDAEVLTIAGS